MVSYGHEDGYMRYSHVLEYGGGVLVFIAAGIVAGGDHAHVRLQEISLRPGKLPATLPPGCQNSAVRRYLSGYRGSDNDLRTFLCLWSSRPSSPVAGHQLALAPPEHPLRRPPRLEAPICVANSSKDGTENILSGELTSLPSPLSSSSEGSSLSLSWTTLLGCLPGRGGGPRGSAALRLPDEALGCLGLAPLLILATWCDLGMARDPTEIAVDGQAAIEDTRLADGAL